jgi:hypothetical protein
MAEQARGGHQRDRQHERAEHREGVEGDAAVVVGGEPRGLEHHARAAVQQRAAEQQGHPAQPAAPRIDLGRGEQRADRVDRRAQQPEQMRRAPQRDVEAEETVPDIVDGRGQDHQRHAPGGEVEPARADQAGHADRARPRTPAARPPCLERQHAEGDDEARGHA